MAGIRAIELARASAWLAAAGGRLARNRNYGRRDESTRPRRARGRRLRPATRYTPRRRGARAPSRLPAGRLNGAPDGARKAIGAPRARGRPPVPPPFPPACATPCTRLRTTARRAALTWMDAWSCLLIKQARRPAGRHASVREDCSKPRALRKNLRIAARQQSEADATRIRSKLSTSHPPAGTDARRCLSRRPTHQRRVTRSVPAAAANAVRPPEWPSRPPSARGEDSRSRTSKRHRRGGGHGRRSRREGHTIGFWAVKSWFERWRQGGGTTRGSWSAKSNRTGARRRRRGGRARGRPCARSWQGLPN